MVIKKKNGQWLYVLYSIITQGHFLTPSVLIIQSPNRLEETRTSVRSLFCFLNCVYPFLNKLIRSADLCSACNFSSTIIYCKKQIHQFFFVPHSSLFRHLSRLLFSVRKWFQLLRNVLLLL